MEAPFSRDEFSARLYALAPRYWDGHPFHVRLHAGGCTPEEVRSWVANRWYYQRNLSRKNGAIIANCPVPGIRARWAERILFQDGGADGEPGGLEDWLVLGEAVGLSRESIRAEEMVLRGVRFAVDAYVRFCLERPWIEAVAAALTELFSPDLMSDRLQVFRHHYPWIKEEGYAYFESRIPVVRKDSEYTLGLVLDHCVTREQQEAAVQALAFKCDVLGAMLDAIAYASATA